MSTPPKPLVTKMDNQPKQMPAFPITAGNHVYNTGMTLRDYFAAKAMQSYVQLNETGIIQPSEIAEYAYSYADAMLAERSKTPTA